MTKRYVEQYERVKRWYERLREIHLGKEHNLPSDYYQDEVFAFFINCYHLKDWIKNDPTSRVSENDVERYVSNSEYLSVCADLCNGTKHLSLTRNSRTGNDVKMGGRNFFLEIGGKLSIFKARYKVISGNKEYDAFDLASKCVDDWKKFMKDKSLL